MTACRGVPLALLAIGDASTLVLARPDLGTLGRLSCRPAATVSALGPDRAVLAGVATLLWLVACWVAVGLAAVIGSVLPGVLGRSCAAVAGVSVPVVARRVVLTALGIGLVAGPAAAATAATPMSSAAGGRAQALAHLASTPGPAWPGDPRSTPRRAPTPTPAAGPRQHARIGSQVAVERGDSLWLIAARRLGDAADPSKIAAYWPSVYAANRSVIDTDPDVIKPGTVLRLPEPSLEPQRVVPAAPTATTTPTSTPERDSP